MDWLVPIHPKMQVVPKTLGYNHGSTIETWRDRWITITPIHFNRHCKTSKSGCGQIHKSGTTNEKRHNWKCLMSDDQLNQKPCPDWPHSSMIESRLWEKNVRRLASANRLKLTPWSPPLDTTVPCVSLIDVKKVLEAKRGGVLQQLQTLRKREVAVKHTSYKKIHNIHNQTSTQFISPGGDILVIQVTAECSHRKCWQQSK